MKRRLFLAICAVATAAFIGGAAYAQEHVHHWDANHPAFDDHERTVLNGWWEHHRDHPVIGFRVGDRLPPNLEGQLRPGFVLTADWRSHWLHRAPTDLIAVLPPPPPHFGYYVIGGHVCLIDLRSWRVADIISVTF
jgi:hypothetical protein